MGSQDQGVIQSSILLLQERFKQLEKEKEMREKRELLRMFNEPKEKINSYVIPTSIQCYDPSKFFFHPELVIPDNADECTVADHRRPSSSSEMRNIGRDVTNVGATKRDATFKGCNGFDDPGSDVDTSLHL
ncbi:hypothetical protein Droror1_Dr00020514 [Drosera rotundifolia]